MATKKEIIDIQVKYGSLDGLNNALKETNEELQKVPLGSQAFKDLSKQAQSLEGALEDVNKEVEGMTADKKFMAMNGAVKLFAGGVAASVGVLGTLGVESEKLGKFQEKAASALAFGVGLKDAAEGYTELAKSGKLAEIQTKLVSAATKAWAAVQTAFNAVMAMNPLGILIVSLTAAGALIYTFRDSIMNLIKSALGPFKGIVDSIAGAFNKLMVSVGLADSEIEKSIKGRIASYEQEAKLAAARGESTLELEKKQILAKQKLEEEGSEAYIALKKEEEVINAKIRKEKQDADAKAATEQEALDKQAAEKRKAASDKILADKKANDAQAKSLLEKIQQEELDLLAKTDQEKLDLQYKRQLAEIDALKVSEDEKARIKLEAEENYGIKSQEIKQKQSDEDLAKLLEREQAEKDRQLELEQLTAETDIEKRNAEVMIVEEQYKRLIDKAKEAGEDTTTLEAIKAAKIKKIDDDSTAGKIANAEAEAAVKEQAMNQSVDAIQGALSNLFGESKAIASANVLVDAGQAAVGIIKSSTSIPAPFNIPFQVAQFALLATTTMGSLKQINSAAPGKTSGNQTPRGGVGSVPMQAPTLPQGFEAPQTLTAQPVVKAYVVSGDTRNAMEAEAKINSRRTLG